jgi:methionine-rich copper-binding protein CopC
MTDAVAPRRLAAGLGLALALLLTAVPAVLAHAILLAATPAAGSIVNGPDVDVRLRYNSRIDGARSHLDLVLPDKQVRPLKLAAQEAPDTLTAKAAGLAAGAYRLRWQVLAADGHITRGEVPFQVK